MRKNEKSSHGMGSRGQKPSHKTARWRMGPAGRKGVSCPQRFPRHITRLPIVPSGQSGCGEVPERSIGTVSKTVVLLVGTEGSNPSLSAKKPVPDHSDSSKYPGFLLLASRYRIPGPPPSCSAFSDERVEAVATGGLVTRLRDRIGAIRRAVVCQACYRKLHAGALIRWARLSSQSLPRRAPRSRLRGDPNAKRHSALPGLSRLGMRSAARAGC